VKLVKREGQGFLFQLDKREKQLLLGVLNEYPVQATAFPLSKSIAREEIDEDQRLLEEALAEQRAENKRRLRAFLREKDRFAAEKDAWQFRIANMEMEWLLQVLNDIRVGSWIKLGSPDPGKSREMTVDETTVRHLWSMELAANFQMDLLRAADGRH